MLLPLAVDPSLLALAVVAAAVGPLDQAGGAAGALLLAGGGHPARERVRGQQEQEQGQQQEAQRGGDRLAHLVVVDVAPAVLVDAAAVAAVAAVAAAAAAFSVALNQVIVSSSPMYPFYTSAHFDFEKKKEEKSHSPVKLSPPPPTLQHYECIFFSFPLPPPSLSFVSDLTLHFTLWWERGMIWTFDTISPFRGTFNFPKKKKRQTVEHFLILFRPRHERVFFCSLPEKKRQQGLSLFFFMRHF